MISPDNIRFSSNTKLLLTGEYFVLYGAKALVLPLKFQQHLETQKNQGAFLEWRSEDTEGIFFEMKLKLPGLALVYSTHQQIASFLIRLLKTCQKLNPLFLSGESGWQTRTKMDFNRAWGIGSSSTLIVNIAQWADVDPFKLHGHVSQGSGYDIAAALHDKPFIFQRDAGSIVQEELVLPPLLSNHIWFIHSREFKHTENEIEKILQTRKPSKDQIKRISELSREVAQLNSLKNGIDIINEHEYLTGRFIDQTPVRQKQFHDFDGAVKSLGAWGGDFWMVLSDWPQDDIFNYFSEKGYHEIFPFQDIIKANVNGENI